MSSNKTDVQPRVLGARAPLCLLLVVASLTSACAQPAPASVAAPATPTAALTATPTAPPTPTPVPTPTPKPTPVPLPPTTTFNFVFDAGVSDQDKADIRDGATLASVFAINTFGNDPARTITVAVHKGESPYSCCFTTSSTRIDIYVDHIVWNSSYVAPGIVGVERRKIMVHEYVHTLQYARGCIGLPKVPVWFFEGMAEYSGVAAVIGAGLIQPAQARAYHIAGLKAATTTLQSSEGTYTGFSYSLAYMALDQLLIGKTMLTFGAFCDAVGLGRDWHDAFASAFGISASDFYLQFEAYRKNPS